MQLSYIIAVAVATMLSSPALACKCFSGSRQDDGKTKSCCSQLHGVFRSGNDCQAGSISEHLSNFRSCCGGRSDCDFPKMARSEEDIEAEWYTDESAAVV